MTPNAVPRIAAPVILAAAIVLSYRPAPPVPTVELPPGEPPAPPAADVRAALQEAVAPDGPGYDRGTARATVTVLEFADFGCPYCARFAKATYPALAAEFVRTGKVRWKYVPFVMGMFPNGGEAARAAECAGDQGPAAFGRMHDRLFAGQSEWKATADAAGLFRSYAVETGLDPSRFAACYAGDEPDRRIRVSNDLADHLGVRATPTFFIDGRRVEGALPADQFRGVLLDALRTRGN